MGNKVVLEKRRLNFEAGAASGIGTFSLSHTAASQSGR
jgi:hypothetical protein